MKLSLIVAMSRDGVIGNNGKLPWDRIPEDMALFRNLTMGHSVILGRKTWDSIGRKPLKGRKHVIVSRSLNLNDDEYSGKALLYIARSPVEAVCEAFDCHGAEQSFVIGGSELYKVLGPLCDEAHVTIVHRDVRGDTTFPIDIQTDLNWKLSGPEKWLAPGVEYRHYTRGQ